jgi:hypothetical protein
MRVCQEVAKTTGQLVKPRPINPQADPSWRRFWVAHAAGHAILSDSCKWPYVVPTETEVNYLAGLLLAPDRLVQAAVKSCLLKRSGPAWDPDCGGVVSEVAEKLMVPGWVAVKRIAESGQLDFYLPIEEEA